jgi:hypothetical protein
MDHLPLLDAVIRETLRLHAPVFATSRAATRDDVLPLAMPFVDRAGVERTSLPLRKGEILLMPIRMVNRDPRTWGPDAGEWRCVPLRCELHLHADRGGRQPGALDRRERWRAGQEHPGRVG